MRIATLLLVVLGACAADTAPPVRSEARVLYAVDPELTTQTDAIVEAAEVWSQALGRAVFAPCEIDDARPHLFVTSLGVSERPDHAGWTTWSRRGPLSATQGTIRLRVGHMGALPAHQALGIIVHEFGHVLNVDHAAGDHNVMRETFVPLDWEISAESVATAQHFVTH